MTTGLATIGPQAVIPQASLAFEPSDIGQGVQLAKLLVASRLLPKSIATPEAAFVVIMAGRELGLTAMQSIRSIHVVDGKPTMSADLMVALTKRSPACEFLRLVESTTERAAYETRRRGEPDTTTIGFTIDDASKAGLLGRGPWRQYPAAMLRARAAAAICRAVYPDLMLGVYETDELAGGGNAPDVEPVRYEQVEHVNVAEQAKRVAEAAAAPPNYDAPSLDLSAVETAPNHQALLDVCGALKAQHGQSPELVAAYKKRASELEAAASGAAA